MYLGASKPAFEVRMMSKHLRSTIICLSFPLLVSIVICGCEASNPFTPVWPAEVLLSAPEESEVQGQKYVLETSLWRDFMPICPPDGDPMIALIHVCTKDSSDLPAELNITRVWVVNGKEVWETKFSGQAPRPNSFTLERIARGGPKWGPDLKVNVVVGLVYKPEDRIYLLKASDQLIFSTH
jgi:hypothetical protein